jgi:Meckel syndrome type 1 protein
VISTFVLTVGVGFYASSRLINEPKKSTDSIAALDATPVNRIALSWPAPARQSEPLALDFAVTAKALRNPVRDVTHEPSATEQKPEPQTPPVRTTATDLAVPPAEKPATKPTEALSPTTTEAVPAPVVSETPKPTPDPDIRVAVQYPPILELPPELQAPVIPPAPVAAIPEVHSEAPATTGSITGSPQNPEAADDPAPQADKPLETKIASRPEPDDASVSDNQVIEPVPLPKPAPKLNPAKAAAKKAASKKAAPKKAVRRPIRRAAPVAIPAPNFFNMFTQQQPR